MKIYAHCPREWMELHELGRRMFGLFIGHTSKEYLEERWDNGDYSHFIEEPHVIAEYDVHSDITDHWIHDELMLEDGWYRYNQLSEFGRSPDFFVTDKDRETALKILRGAVGRVNKYFVDYEKQYGESPAKEKKKSKDRTKEYHRRIKPQLMNLILEGLQNLKKDAKIAVVSDAYGRACEYLLSKGFINITTDTEHNVTLKAVSNDVLDKVNVVEKVTGKHDVVIGNPPYQKGKNSNFYVEFIKKGAELLNEGGLINLITPNRFILPHTPASQALLGNFQVEKYWIDVNKYFPGVGTNIGMFKAFRSESGHTGLCEFELPNGEVVELDPREINLPSRLPTLEGLERFRVIKALKHFTFVKKQPTHYNYVYVCRQWKTEGGRPYFDAEVGHSKTGEKRDGRYIETDNPQEVCDYLRSTDYARELHELFGDQMNIWPFLWNYIPTNTNE